MSETVLVFPLSSFPNGKAKAAPLMAEIAAEPAITHAALGIVVSRDDCAITFEDALGQPELDALDAVVAAHQGVATAIKFHAVSTMVVSQLPITGLTWQVLGKVRASPSFFTMNLSGVLGRLVGEVKTIGAGAKLRLVEVSGGVEVDMTPTPFDCPDTAGEWQPVKFSTQVPPRLGDNTYRLEGLIDASTTASVDACALALLEVLVS